MAPFEPARTNDFTRSGPNGGSPSGAPFNPASGGASGGEDLYPIVTLSGGGGNSGGGREITGIEKATLETPIPVGTRMNVKVEPPSGGYALETVTIGGMSDVSSYMKVNSDVAPPPFAGPENEVNTQPTPAVGSDAAQTSFIVDATPRTYGIEVNATYTLLGTETTFSGKTTIRFTSARPEEASLSIVGQAGFSVTTADGRTELKLNNPPMEIDSNTKSAVKFGGEFMFMQLVRADRTVTFADDTTYSIKTDSFRIDDGYPSTLGYPAVGKLVLDANPELDEVTSWTLNPDKAPLLLFAMSDAPATWGPANAKQIVMNDSFRTYLMFRPAGGVWIALAQLNWSYNVSASNIPGPGWAIDPGAVLPNPGNVIAPLGNDAFPTWIGRVSQYPFL